MKKRILSLFLAVTIMFTVFVPAPALVSAEETTEEVKTAFTVEELLQMGFYSSVDYTSTDLTNIYKLSINNTIEDFDNTIITYLGSPSRYYYLNISDEVTFTSTIYPLVIMPKYYTYSDDNYNYYSNYSNNLSIYPYTVQNRTKIMADNADWSNASTMKSVVDGDYIFTLRKSKTTNEVSYFRCSYEFYSHMGFSSPADIFSCDYFLNDGFDYTVDYYCINRQDNSTSTDPDLPSEKNYNIWGVRVGEVDKDGFLEWIINNDRIGDITASGVDFASDKIAEVIDWWEKYGTSPLRIVSGIPKLLSIINIVELDLSLASSLVNCIDQLYIEYKAYLKQRDAEQVGINNTAHPHWRNPDSETDLTEDVETDDTVISILREILRTLIYLPENISKFFGYFDVYFDAILIDFNRLIAYMDSLPDYFATSAYNVFIDPINQIIEALGNVGTSNNIEIEIPETKQDEVDLFFDTWHTDLSEKLNSKVPIFNQLSELFNDNFFEKCGLDVNDDGQVYQYYSAGTVSSSGSTSDEVAAVESLLLQFDKADTNFANIEYSGDIPDGWTVTIAGNDIEIFDFKVFARYRSKIHIIIVFVAYTAYLLSLFKSLPTIIGNVSDVQNAFTSHFEQSRNKEE